jgi:hypothetical protein
MAVLFSYCAVGEPSCRGSQQEEGQEEEVIAVLCRLFLGSIDSIWFAIQVFVPGPGRIKLFFL